MPLTERHRKQVIIAYCIIFYLLMFFKLSNGFLLVQLQPALFNTRFDLLTWIMMTTGIHQRLLNNPAGWATFDIVFYIMPLLYLLTYLKARRLCGVVAAVMLVINWVYIECYTLYPANSIESFTPWLLFPFLLMANSLRTFYFILHGLRYFFLFFFASAAIWKLVQGGFFNAGEMSAILLYQHKEYLASSPNYWYSHFIYWLVNHTYLSYILYVAATILEGSFIIGFFRRQYDPLLFIFTLLFLITDQFLMRIPYWEITPFLLTFLYSKYTEPVAEL